ncbi:MAG TPA: glycerol-3-phosphate dehydrogenase [Steroidobacteraceae bacterium]|nr:glycerol-3-phosphate dehydrogenase [Steroidobacteraceae bacterium]
MQESSGAAGAPIFDLLVVGGGINGVGIARDAAGRGLSVMVVERSDLASATSSASSKLIHGGLRYLEQYEFRLVRESLAEREVLLAAAPYIIRPLRFVLPVHSGLRPPWLLRLGLFLYDHIGGRKRLPGTRTVRRDDAVFTPLAPGYRSGFEYSDCWADDARLVVVNALDAQQRGARIETGWAVTAARRDGALWSVGMTSRLGDHRTISARALVNAAGPWVEDILRAAGAYRQHRSLRLVKGSHIIVKRLYDGPQAYTLQNADGRVVFAIPYEDDFTLIGTTDIPFSGDPTHVQADGNEVAYLCGLISGYLRAPISPKDVVWTYSGVRPLYDDGGTSASTVTRDYVFDMDTVEGQAPLLSVFGGKLTTYRKLAEHALSKLLPVMRIDRPEWTRHATLPGGDLPGADLAAFTAEQLRRYAFAPPELTRRLCRSYGTRIEHIFGTAKRLGELGAEVAPRVYEAELNLMRAQEWARTGADALWRRSKLGLHLDEAGRDRVTAWFGA